eukprot:16447305-Heterocapsa_arctica.AAC.1
MISELWDTEMKAKNVMRTIRLISCIWQLPETSRRDFRPQTAASKLLGRAMSRPGRSAARLRLCTLNVA